MGKTAPEKTGDQRWRIANSFWYKALRIYGPAYRQAGLCKPLRIVAFLCVSLRFVANLCVSLHFVAFGCEPAPCGQNGQDRQNRENANAREWWSRSNRDGESEVDISCRPGTHKVRVVRGSKFTMPLCHMDLRISTRFPIVPSGSKRFRLVPNGSAPLKSFK